MASVVWVDASLSNRQYRIMAKVDSNLTEVHELVKYKLAADFY